MLIWKRLDEPCTKAGVRGGEGRERERRGGKGRGGEKREGEG